MYVLKNDIVLVQLLDRKDRKDVVCPLTPSTTSSDSSSPVPSSSEEGGAEETSRGVGVMRVAGVGA